MSNRQTDKQTNNDDYISFLAEVTTSLNVSVREVSNTTVVTNVQPTPVSKSRLLSICGCKTVKLTR